MAQAASIAWPASGQPLWWLQLLSLAVLCGLLDSTRTAREAGALGWTYATAWLTGCFWWLFIAMHVYGGLASVLSILAVLALAGALALYYAAACAAYRAWRPSAVMTRPLLFAALWLCAELARGSWLTGFGWGGSGYAHVGGPLAMYAPWIGVYGISALAAGLSLSMADAVCSRIRVAVHGAAWLVLLGGLPWILSGRQPLLTQPHGVLDVALLQGNIPQNEKFVAGSGVEVALRWYGAALRDNDSSLVLAPETAIPVLLHQLPPGYAAALGERYATGGQAAVLGVPLGSYREGYTNSAIALLPGGAPWHYDKHHLVPFGEFIPWGFHWFTRMMNIPLGDFRAGALNQPSLDWQGQRLGANICYEDLFGEELAARFVDEPQAPTLFMNLSNIAWFGDGLAIDQHLSISRMRAMELGRPFVRATNTGATAVIDHEGRVLAELPRQTRGILKARVEGRTGLTPYARWASVAGLWPYWMVAGLLVVLIRSRRGPIRGPDGEPPEAP